jgi:hypothetical protein
MGLGTSGLHASILNPTCDMSLAAHHELAFVCIRGTNGAAALPVQMNVQFAGTGGTANELAKIRYITQVCNHASLWHVAALLHRRLLVQLRKLMFRPVGAGQGAPANICSVHAHCGPVRAHSAAADEHNPEGL